MSNKPQGFNSTVFTSLGFTQSKAHHQCVLSSQNYLMQAVIESTLNATSDLGVTFLPNSVEGAGGGF